MKPDWNRQGVDWPNREASCFVSAGGLRWHVQVLGQGPVLLLLHGSGAATHSWRDLAPMLARDFTVIAPDLPGHGFTDTPTSAGLSLPGMAHRLDMLLDALEARPALAVGHSAGAALALRLALDGRIGPGGVVSINGALAPFPGSSGRLYPLLAQALFLNPLAIQMFAWRAARPGTVARLITGTGSRLDERGLDLYERLIRCSGHVTGVLGMMSNWSLEPLVRDLPNLRVPLTLVAGENDPRRASQGFARRPRARARLRIDSPPQAWAPRARGGSRGGGGHRPERLADRRRLIRPGLQPSATSRSPTRLPGAARAS